ncbi:hypothetical protein AVEN_181664-1 [Araneus ventricosus]|uniref:Uncharacterized protein n=1 Tax=Araneus ventricosus TaxID=182803 RepID=A0A4Y2HR88_ARAVE|nr:hypothetical protein AVEN_181664-1 [Araneus ventricosus]
MSTIIILSLTGLKRDVIFFSPNMDLSLPTSKFHLSDSDYCSCGGDWPDTSPATECIYTVSGIWEASINFEQMAEKGRQPRLQAEKIRGIIKFIRENEIFFSDS